MIKTMVRMTNHDDEEDDDDNDDFIYEKKLCWYMYRKWHWNERIKEGGRTERNFYHLVWTNTAVV